MFIYSFSEHKVLIKEEHNSNPVVHVFGSPDTLSGHLGIWVWGEFSPLLHKTVPLGLSWLHKQYGCAECLWENGIWVHRRPWVPTWSTPSKNPEHQVPHALPGSQHVTHGTIHAGGIKCFPGNSTEKSPGSFSLVSPGLCPMWLSILLISHYILSLK